MTPKTVTVKIKKGIRPDGELEVVNIKQDGYGELRLTKEQTISLIKVLEIKIKGVV